MKLRWGDLERTSLQEGNTVSAHGTPLADIVQVVIDLGLDPFEVSVEGTVGFPVPRLGAESAVFETPQTDGQTGTPS